MGKRILIIDDEPDVVTYLEAVLQSNGYTVFSIENARDGIDRVSEIKPDLICLDIMMPEETGVTFYNRLRKNSAYDNIPVIIITGVVQNEENEIKAYFADKSISLPDYYMEKPINVDHFLARVGKLVSGTKPSPKRKAGRAKN